MSPDVIDLEKPEFKLEEKRLDAEKQARIVGLNTDEKKMFPNVLGQSINHLIQQIWDSRQVPDEF